MSDWVVGVDLGGTKIEIGLVNPLNQIVGRRRIPTNASEGPQAVVERITQNVLELAELLPAGAQITALGICSPGPVDHETGTLIDPPNLAGLHNAPLRQMLAESLNMPVSLEHDAKATALGEFYYGAGRCEKSMIYMIVGTGVGGAVIADGQLLRGLYNSAGEIGHVTLDRNGEVCSCGNKGCVETFIAGPWLAWRYEKALVEQNGSLPADQQPITGERVAALSDQGDALARKVMTDAGESLGIAVASLAMILNIDLFVVGGSVVKSGDLFLESARQVLPQHSYRSVSCGVKIVPTELGDDGPILGCAWLARQAITDPIHASVKPDAKAERLSLTERDLLEAVEGIVFDIQRFSLHDGPGVRTDVFLKGCPLRCPWCANPESQRLQPELAFSEKECISCGLFDEPCLEGWSVDGLTQAGREKYSERAEACPGCAMHWTGKRLTAGEVIQEVLRDLPFYNEGGGMTLTGGEPTFQPRMAEALLRLAKNARISTAIETTGHTRWKILERLLPYLDHIYYDLKHLDSETHRAFVGVDNTIILSNLRNLAALNAPVTVRVPLIPGFNATEENIGAIADFVQQLDGLAKTVDLLPYHTLGRAKYKALAREYPWESYDRLTDEAVERLVQVAASRGLAVNVGG